MRRGRKREERASGILRNAIGGGLRTMTRYEEDFSGVDAGLTLVDAFHLKGALRQMHSERLPSSLC